MTSNNSQARPTGIHYFGKDGKQVFEIGCRLIECNPDLSQKLGSIAAAWAQTEGLLTCYLAELMGTPPERTFALLKAYKNAASLVDGARNLGKAVLDEARQQEFTDLLRDFDEVRIKRNRLQHDLWGQLDGEEAMLRSVSSLDFTRLVVSVYTATREAASSASKSGVTTSFISIMDEAAENLRKAPITSLETLTKLEDDIYSIMQRLMEHIATSLKSSLSSHHLDPSSVSIGKVD